MQTNLITIDNEIQSGQTVFTGTRVPVKSFFDYVTTGESIETYLEDYPSVKKEQINEFLKLLSNLFQKTTETIFYENTYR